MSRVAAARVLVLDYRLAPEHPFPAAVDDATAAGVDVTFEPWDEMIHVWHLFAATLPEGQQAIERIGEFVQKHVA